MIYLTVDDLLYIAERAIGAPPVVRDLGLLEAACARPQASWRGVDSYPTLDRKAAALVHSIVGNRALVDGNKRLGLAGLVAFLGVNGWRLTWSNDGAFNVITSIADGSVDSVFDIAARIRDGSAPR